MSPTLRDIDLRSWYTSGRDDIVNDFYSPCLRAAVRYDRAVGFFSSTIYAVLGVALADFVERGGQMRLICSPCLSEEDIAGIERGLDQQRRIDEMLVSDIRTLVQQPFGCAAVELLATLLAAGVLDIRIAYRSGSAGIFHSKVGTFESTDGLKIAFTGSANETAAAVLPEWNHESFMVFTSWRGEVDAERVAQLAEYFDSLWCGREPRLEVREFPDVPRAELIAHRNEAGTSAAIERARVLVSTSARPAHARYEPTPLMAHQTAAVANWEEAGHRGIVKHATGAGKTLTALEAIRRWIRPGRPAIVFVPSDLLSAQWLSVAQSELRDIDSEFLTVGGSDSSKGWERDLPDFTRAAAYLSARVVIATMQSGCTPRFLERVVDGDHLLVVADEVHRIGSPRRRSILCLRAGARLGLGATPERYGDPEGTAAILDYFGPILEPEFGIPDAILAGRLVPYDYYVHMVSLTEAEQERWDVMTTRIQRTYARLPEDGAGRKIQTNQFRMMLIQRAAILKRAACKVDLARDILTEHYCEGDRWLVYCDYGEQLESVLGTLRDAELPTYEYRSEMEGAHAETLEYFERRGGVLVAIRCLDEGVDIPSVNRALILASSSNPREFIQRRGRVLRRAPGKYSATVHDALVVPASDAADEVDRLPILRVEMARATEFARHAQNRAVHHELRRIAMEAGLGNIDDAVGDFEDERDD